MEGPRSKGEAGDGEGGVRDSRGGGNREKKQKYTQQWVIIYNTTSTERWQPQREPGVQSAIRDAHS